MGRARGTMDCWEGEKDLKIRLKKKKLRKYILEVEIFDVIFSWNYFN